MSRMIYHLIGEPELALKAKKSDGYKTASGSIASFPDGADGVPVKSLSVAIEPVQAGTGDPSPDNVRPISGWTEANVTRAGENLFSETWEQGQINASGANASATNRVRTVGYINVAPGMTFAIKRTQTSGIMNVRGYDAAKTFVGSGGDILDLVSGNTATNPMSAGMDSCVIKIKSGVHYIRLQDYSNDLTTVYTMAIGSTPIDTSVPYRAESLSVSWESEAGTVYGGTLDVTGGKLTVDRAIVDLGMLTWTIDSKGFARCTMMRDDIVHPVNGQTLANILCSSLKPMTATEIYNGSNGVGIHLNGDIRVRFDGMGTTGADVKSAVNGFILCYELATPITIDLTPQQMTTLLGTNNIWSDAGDVTVEYKRRR